jgi:hypothetical protein
MRESIMVFLAFLLVSDFRFVFQNICFPSLCSLLLFTFLAHFFIIIQRKAYGAGLLSSFGELEYSMGANAEKPKVLAWDPFDAAGREYPITTYQYVFFFF